MIDFAKIKVNDKMWIDPLLAAADMSGCQHNFTNLFVWSKINQYQVGRIDDYLVVKGEQSDGRPYYLYPAGEGDPKSVLEAIWQDAADCGHSCILAGLSIDNMAVLKRLFPNRLEYTERRDAFDYVYLLDKLVTLTGDKNKAKRNHVNYFKKNIEWSFEPISSHNLEECWDMNKEWCRVHRCKDDEQLANENCAVNRCFDNYYALGLEGGLLRSAGRVIAFTMGDRLNSDTFDTHVEKAYADIRGAYQMINQQFAAMIQQNHPEIVYVNREEDMGYEGLRKAKLSYHPDKMEVKYWAEFER
ncbi:MAG: DUF2156 domain-containing protein [Methylocystaceae bacterium]